MIDTVKTVLWGAVGIRRRNAAESLKLNPVHVIIAAIALVAMFVFTLVTIVRIVTS